MQKRKISIEALKIDCQKVEHEILEFIRRIVGEAKAEGVIVGLSGGIDSAVVAVLCVRALGREKVLGLLMPDSEVTPPSDMEDAKNLAVKLGIKTYTVLIDFITKAFLENIPLKKDRVAIANVRARIRMTINYLFANVLNYLVVGTGDRSEHLIGYFTKYGDGGIDFLPIAHLYKTQVKQLGRHLGLARDIIEKPSSPQLWRGQKATDEIPADYNLLDLILYAIFDLEMEHEEIALQLNLHLKLVQEVQRRYDKSMHKRAYPLMLGH
ncbi:MAG: NAD+ synthase [archaeon]|nr:NAD+ synthase [archaeon]MCP8305503.1 NAD+ synthase [archaeon]